MKRDNPRDFAEVCTHDGARGLIESVVERFGSRYGAKITNHRYESTSPYGVVFVYVEKTGAQQAIRYGLPDDRDELRKLAIAALEPTEQWKSQHERDW